MRRAARFRVKRTRRTPKAGDVDEKACLVASAQGVVKAAKTALPQRAAKTISAGTYSE